MNNTYLIYEQTKFIAELCTYAVNGALILGFLGIAFEFRRN